MFTENVYYEKTVWNLIFFGTKINLYFNFSTKVLETSCVYFLKWKDEEEHD